MLALRNQFKLSLGSAYPVGEQRGKTELDISFQNGTRQLKTIDMTWLHANSRLIQESVEKIDIESNAWKIAKKAKEIKNTLQKEKEWRIFIENRSKLKKGANPFIDTCSK